jgi:tetratricopeptide (TPR) repeat protein
MPEFPQRSSLTSREWLGATMDPDTQRDDVLGGEALLQQGEALLREGRSAEAVPLLRICMNALPANPLPPRLLASALLDLGDGKAAWRAAKRAVLRAPDCAAAQRVLGRALLAVGLAEPAVEALTKASRLAGEDAEAWFELGQACEAAALPSAATAALRRAMQIDPAHARAAARLARRTRLAGDDEGAEALLRAAMERRPDAIELRLELASLLRADRPQEALALLDAAAGAEHLDAGAAGSDLAQRVVLYRVMTLIELERHDEARALVETIKKAPAGLVVDLVLSRLQLAVAAGQAADARLAAETLERALDRPDEDPDRRVAAHFHLSQFWLRFEQADRAFALMAAGHRLAAQAQPYSRVSDTRLVEASTALLTRDRLHGGARAGNTDATPIFIVGMPRSGTTLAEQILASHPAVHGAGERTALARSFLRLGDADTAADCIARIAGLRQPALDEAAAEYLAALTALAPGRARVVDKMPANFRFLGLVALLLPGARIIHCVRDPRDIGFSIWRRRFRGLHPYAHDMRDLGWYIGQHCRLMEHWRSALPNPIMRIHLHQWVHDFDRTLRRVLDFVGLPYDPACERFHELDRTVRTASSRQVREPVNDRGMSRWRPYAAQLTPLIEELQESGALPR